MFANVFSIILLVFHELIQFGNTVSAISPIKKSVMNYEIEMDVKTEDIKALKSLCSTLINIFI